MTAPDITFETTEDRALGGRLTLRQPKRGHRFGHDAILLAAATPAAGGETAVELGAGVGAAGLALAHRVPGLRVVLAEIDPALAALAQHNAARNAMADRVRAVACDVTAPDLAARLGLAPASVDAVLMNPPFNDAERQNMSPYAARRRAHVGDAQTLPHWVAAAAGLLRLQGTLSLIWRADGLDAVRAALSGAFGDLAVREVYPRPGKPAIRVLVRAVKGGGAVAAALPGLTLADDEGRPSDAAEAVLRHGAALI
ncbi:MAG: tRNA1(Val) (adenine(37)-N6)-methyltransferase [Xanthobacteraceae bacterium]|uniref:tRNA1(Val) (adenine(37)-N6)-methyltransferase n=1 Tax=Pseudolabrys sp. TaxID=1960880 RepID=UPI003D13B224